MVGFRDILDLVEAAEKTSQQGDQPAYGGWTAELPNTSSEAMEVAEIIVGKKIELPEVCTLEPGETVTIHHGSGTDSENEFHLKEAPLISSDDIFYILNSDGELTHFSRIETE